MNTVNMYELLIRNLKYKYIKDFKSWNYAKYEPYYTDIVHRQLIINIVSTLSGRMNIKQLNDMKLLKVGSYKFFMVKIESKLAPGCIRKLSSLLSPTGRTTYNIEVEMNRMLFKKINS